MLYDLALARRTLAMGGQRQASLSSLEDRCRADLKERGVLCGLGY